MVGITGSKVFFFNHGLRTLQVHLHKKDSPLDCTNVWYSIGRDSRNPTTGSVPATPATSWDYPRVISHPGARGYRLWWVLPHWLVPFSYFHVNIPRISWKRIGGGKSKNHPILGFCRLCLQQALQKLTDLLTVWTHVIIYACMKYI